MLTFVEPDAASIHFLKSSSFIATFVGSRALLSAYELGLINHLIERRSSTVTNISKAIGADYSGTSTLISLLTSTHVLECRNEDYSLSSDFLECLPYSDYILTKLRFATLLLPDFTTSFSTYITDPPLFRERSILFSIFNYSLCASEDPQSHFQTSLWVRLTSILTQYESRPLLDILTFSVDDTILDIGGNSGALALAICEKISNVSILVLDLPLVCKLGLANILGSGHESRIAFSAYDIRTTELPLGYSVHIFKSFLHDWSDEDTLSHLRKSVASLARNGRIIIFERISSSPFNAENHWSFADLPILLFERSYRSPELYIQLLSQLGLTINTAYCMKLDYPFCIIEAIKS